MTQISKAKKRSITEEVKTVAAREKLDAEKISKLVASGRVVITANTSRKNVVPIGVGESLRCKVNANIGTSPDVCNEEEEILKAKAAVKYGADAVMDLSIGGDIDATRKKVLDSITVPVGTVPIYQTIVSNKLPNTTEDDILNCIEKHCREVDFITVHSGITLETIPLLKKRLLGVVSRGGSFLCAWMMHNNAENPLYSNFDEVLRIAKENDVVLSLGDGLRPGCLADATDKAQIAELKNLGALARRAREAGVQAMIEGPGHIPLNQIEKNVQLQKKYCDNAPFYVLGPLVTDIGAGYDHITAAIGGAVAGMAGADFLCYVTPAEHLALPDLEDVREGVVATKIAAHAVDVARGIDADVDDRMACARRDFDWDAQFSLMLDEDKARHYRKRRPPEDDDVCTMCGEHCAIKIFKEYLRKP